MQLAAHRGDVYHRRGRTCANVCSISIILVVSPLERGELPRQTLAVVLSESQSGFADASKIVYALNAVSFGLRFGEGGQQHAGKDTNDGDHNQQLDEGETLIIIFHSLILRMLGCVSLPVFKLKLTRSDTVN